ncbi:hypothetical protein FRC07_010817, partial [Ceratobasidium sp. 392]
GLKLTQAQLSHEKFVLDAKARISTLEQELESLRRTPSASSRLHPNLNEGSTGNNGRGGDGDSSRSWYTFWK